MCSFYLQAFTYPSLSLSLSLLFHISPSLIHLLSPHSTRRISPLVNWGTLECIYPRYPDINQISITELERYDALYILWRILYPVLIIFVDVSSGTNITPNMFNIGFLFINWRCRNFISCSVLFVIVPVFCFCLFVFHFYVDLFFLTSFLIFFSVYFYLF